MKQIFVLILALFLTLAIAGCTRSIAPPPEQPPTAEAPAEAPGEGSSSITVITPETESGSAETSGGTTSTLEAPGGISVLCAYPPDWVPYTVQEGDTLEAIALYFGIEAGDISVANCLYAAGIPEVGETIYLPPAPTANGTGQAAGSESQASGTETQASGTETQASGTETQASGTETQASGGEEASSASSEGSSSQAEKKSSCKSPYKVRSGEWVYKIGRKCNISPYAIIAYNHLSWPYWLRPGQVLLFPKNAPPFPGN
jgi:LysM repeat protein